MLKIQKIQFGKRQIRFESKEIIRLRNNKVMSEFNPVIENSEGLELDSEQRQLFLNPKRSKSEESFLGKLKYKESFQENKNIIFQESHHSLKHQRGQGKKKRKLLKKKSKTDYNKNICGYVTKKILREFISQTFREKVEQLCSSYNCDYNEALAYYFKKIESVTGPSHLPGLLKPDGLHEEPMKRAFAEFFKWFLKERYIRYLIAEGKMERKVDYIRYKNKALMELYEANVVVSFEQSSEKFTG